MRELKLIPRKELKEFKMIIKNQWGADLDFSEYAALKSKDEDIFIANRELFDVDFSELRIDAFGLYFGQLRNNELRLSIEGAQFIGPHARKNIIELSFKEMRELFHGLDVEKEKTAEGYVILKHKNDFIGCSRFKDNKLLNFIPKVRRIKAAD